MPSKLNIIILHHSMDRLRELGELVRALEITAAGKGVELVFIPDRTPKPTVTDVLVLTPGRMNHELVRMLEMLPPKVFPKKETREKKPWDSRHLDSARNRADIRRGREYVMQARMRRRKR
jgi:hypothetical protein